MRAPRLLIATLVALILSACDSKSAEQSSLLDYLDSEEAPAEVELVELTTQVVIDDPNDATPTGSIVDEKLLTRRASTGIACGSSVHPNRCRHKYPKSSKVTLVALPRDADYVFSHWDKCDEADPVQTHVCRMTLDSKAAVSAHFIRNPKLLVRIAMIGSTIGVKVTRNGETVCSYDDTHCPDLELTRTESLELKAVLPAGRKIQGWNVSYWTDTTRSDYSACGTAETCSLTGLESAQKTVDVILGVVE